MSNSPTRTSLRKQLKAVPRPHRGAMRAGFVAKGWLPAFPTPRRDRSVPKKTWHRSGGTKKYVSKSNRGRVPQPAKK